MGPANIGMRWEEIKAERYGTDRQIERDTEQIKRDQILIHSNSVLVSRFINV